MSINTKNSAVSFFAETIATGLGSGKWPFVAPATVGTAAALVFYLVLVELGLGDKGDSIWFFALILITTLLGIWATDYIDSEDDHDPKRGVVDEWVGVWVTMLFIPVTIPWVIAAFLVFRAFDILKPLGVRKLEALPGGVGIMLDDIGAGIIGAILLNTVRLAFFN